MYRWEVWVLCEVIEGIFSELSPNSICKVNVWMIYIVSKYFHNLFGEPYYAMEDCLWKGKEKNRRNKIMQFDHLGYLTLWWGTQIKQRLLI